MADKFEIEVGMLAPTINTAYATGRFNNRRFMSKEGKAYKKLVFDTVRTKPWVVRTDKLYKLTIECWSPRWFTKKGTVFKSDVSNRLKIAEDAICEAIGIDDSLIFEVTVVKRVGDIKTVYCLESFT